MWDVARTGKGCRFLTGWVGWGVNSGTWISVGWKIGMLASVGCYACVNGFFVGFLYRFCLCAIQKTANGLFGLFQLFGVDKVFDGSKWTQFVDGGCTGLCVGSGFALKDVDGSRFAFGYGVCPACVGFACDGAFQWATIAPSVDSGAGLSLMAWVGIDFPVPCVDDGVVFVERNVPVRVGGDQGQVFQGGVMDGVHEFGPEYGRSVFCNGWRRACRIWGRLARRLAAARFDGVRDDAVSGVCVGIRIGCRACFGGWFRIGQIGFPAASRQVFPPGFQDVPRVGKVPVAHTDNAFHWSTFAFFFRQQGKMA